MNSNKKYAKIIVALTILCLLFTILGYALATSTLPTLTISGGVYPGAPSYTIWVESGTYYAKNAYGTIQDRSTNASAVISNAIGNSTGVVYMKEGNYSANITITNNVTLIGAGRGVTIIIGNVFLGSSASRTQFIGLQDLTVQGTVNVSRVNSPFVYRIRAQKFGSLGNWHSNFDDLLLQGGNGSILIADTSAGETNTYCHFGDVMIEDNTVNTDIAVYVVDSNSHVVIDSLGVESSTGFYNMIKNYGTLDIGKATLNPSLTDSAGAATILSGGTITGNYDIEAGVNRYALYLSGSNSHLNLAVGRTYASGDIFISGSNNQINLLTVNTINLAIEGNNNTLTGRFRNVYGGISVTGTNNRMHELTIIDAVYIPTYFEHSFSGSNTTATTAVLNHSLVSTPTYVWASCNTTNVHVVCTAKTSTQVTITATTISGSLPASWSVDVKAEYTP